MIRDYFRKVEAKIEEIGGLIKEKGVEYDILSEKMGIIKGRITFIDGSAFDFREIGDERETDYRFHYMNKEKNLISRWDTAPHHSVGTFPYHLHTTEGVKDSMKVNLIQILELVAQKVIEKL